MYLTVYGVSELLLVPVFCKLQVVLFLFKTLFHFFHVSLLPLESHTHAFGVKAFDCLLWVWSSEYPLKGVMFKSQRGGQGDTLLD